MDSNSIKNSRIKILKACAHLHIIGKKVYKISNESDERYEVVETERRTDGQMDEIKHTQKDKGHCSSLPTLSDKHLKIFPVTKGQVASQNLRSNH